MAQIRFQRDSTSELMRKLMGNITSLADKEVELARQEVRAEMKSALSGIVMVAVGASLLLLGTMCVVFAIIFALAEVIPGWLVSLLAALLFVVIGVALALAGKNRLEIEPLEKTRETLKENVEWVQHRMKSNEK